MASLLDFLALVPSKRCADRKALSLELVKLFGAEYSAVWAVNLYAPTAVREVSLRRFIRPVVSVAETRKFTSSNKHDAPGLRKSSKTGDRPICCPPDTLEKSRNRQLDDRKEAKLCSRHISNRLLRKRAVSFQITVLKVLAGHPDGLASVADLTHYVSILMSSGSDWTNRMKRLAASVPQLDIFGSAFVARQKDGWQITNAGRQFLANLEAQRTMSDSEQRSVDDANAAPLKLVPKLRLVVDNTRIAASSADPNKLSA